jgi:hypothetical protein
MATYYVRPDGSNSNAGSGYLANQAWQTLSYALANMVLGTGINYLYIAPGVYRESPTVSVTPTSTNTLVIQGDPNSEIFVNMAPGIVRVTNYTSDTTIPTSGTSFTCSKEYVTFKNIYFLANGTFYMLNPKNLVLENCVFSHGGNSTTSNLSVMDIAVNSSTVQLNAIIKNCVFYGIQCLALSATAFTSNWNTIGTIQNCVFIGQIGIHPNGNGYGAYQGGIGSFTVTNCTFICSTYAVWGEVTSPSYPWTFRNCNFIGMTNTSYGLATVNNDGSIIENYNRFSTASPRINVAVGGNSITSCNSIDLGYTRLTSNAAVSEFSPFYGSNLINNGTSTGALTTDIFRFPWTLGTDVGSFSRSSLSSTSFYYPTEKNTNDLIIAPNTTSRSETIYLGVTGLTHQTSGLSASYVRTGSARVGFSLASQTVTGSWASGGFVEIDAVNMPGMYRIDIPNAAFSSGASSVTVAIKNSNTAFGTYLSYSLQPVWIDLTQTVPYSNTVQTIGDSLNAARSSGFGKWTLNDKTLTLYGGDNTTVVKTFTLNSNTYPTERS